MGRMGSREVRPAHVRGDVLVFHSLMEDLNCIRRSAWVLLPITRSCGSHLGAVSSLVLMLLPKLFSCKLFGCMQLCCISMENWLVFLLPHYNVHFLVVLVLRLFPVILVACSFLNCFWQSQPSLALYPGCVGGDKRFSSPTRPVHEAKSGPPPKRKGGSGASHSEEVGHEMVRSSLEDSWLRPVKLKLSASTLISDDFSCFN